MEWNFQKIEYFLKVTEEKSLSEAARKMFFSPQALNKNLKQLETDIGVKLINRDRGNGEGMSLTLAGEQMKEFFMPCYQAYQEAIAQMEHYLYQRKSELHIGYFRGLNKNKMLMPLFWYLSGNEEFSNIELSSGELGEVLDWTESEKYDIAITNIHEEEMISEELCYVPIRVVPAKIIISDKHPWAAKEIITAEDIARERLVVLKWNEELEKNSFYRKVRVKERKEVRDIDSLFTEVKTGKVFGVVLAHFEGDYDTSFIQRELPKEYAFSFYFCIIFRKNSYFQNIAQKIYKDREKIWGGVR